MKIIDLPPELREYLEQEDTYKELQRREWDEGSVTCIYCGTQGLYWTKSLKGNWILCKRGKVHRCAWYRRSKT